MAQENEYQFVMIPQQLSSCLDANCGKMLSTLIGLHSILANEDGWFYRSNRDLQLDARLSQNLVKATIDTLYQAGILDIDCIGKGRGHRSNRIHINFESFKKYEHYTFNNIRNNPDLWIDTVPYQNNFTPSYCNKNGKGMCNGLGKGIGKKMTTNTDTTDTTDTSYTTDITYTTNTTDIIDNINNINIKEEMDITNKIIEDTENIFNEEERNVLDIDCTYSISKKEETVEDTYSIPSSTEEEPETPTQSKEELLDIAKQLFMDFLSNPSQDYSPLRTGINLSYFLQRNHRDLDALQDTLRNRCNMHLEPNDVLNYLKYYYEEKIGVR